NEMEGNRLGTVFGRNKIHQKARVLMLSIRITKTGWRILEQRCQFSGVVYRGVIAALFQKIQFRLQDVKHLSRVLFAFHKAPSNGLGSCCRGGFGVCAVLVCQPDKVRPMSRAAPKPKSVAVSRCGRILCSDSAVSG